MKKLLSVLLLFPILFISCGPSAEELAKQEQERLEQLEQEKEAEKIEAERLHNLNALIVQADSLILVRQFKQAVARIDSALTFAKTEVAYLNFKKGNCLAELRLYQEAIDAYTIPIDANNYPAKACLARARCYNNLGERQLAVNDLKVAIKLGNEEAAAYHDKINPELKRVAYYETLCCDGTTSNATGRGACSHHGGVCNWNSPVYQTYRKYE